ncbi:MAG: hypothetical protein IKH78_03680 [Ruminococcus sp.]|nr:hypothetical protein [Ruminococcus sp.]
MDFIFKLTVFLTGFIPLAIYAKEILDIIFRFLLTPFFNMEVKTVSLFGLTFARENDKWKRTFHKATPLIQNHIGWDLKKPPETFTDEREKAFGLINVVIKLVIAAVICYACRGYFSHIGSLNALQLLLVSFALGFAWFSLSSLFILIYVYSVVMKGLGGYANSMLKRLRSGERLENLNMKSLEELGMENSQKSAMSVYYPIYMAHLAAIGDTERMRIPSHQMMDRLIGQDFILQHAAAYYWLLFFFSEIEPNEGFANMILEKLDDLIRKDTDPNGKRILAYYTFNITRNIDLAEKLVNDAYGAIDGARMLDTEKDLERKLLGILGERIRRARAFRADPQYAADNTITPQEGTPYGQ